jgi:hypothetical protein
MARPSGNVMLLKTERSLGLATIYVPARPQKASKHKMAHKESKPNPGKTGAVRQFLQQQAQQQAQGQLNARTRGFYDFIRGPNKREWLENFLWAKLPYHPQWYRSGTRFDAVLEKPLDLGDVSIPSQSLLAMQTPPPADAIAQMRVLSTLSSGEAHPGDPMQGVLSEPLFTPDHKLILPQGTRLSGKITLARAARSFHRGGKLRFALDSVEVPRLALAGNTQADLEGTARATESKTRLLRPVIAALVAAKSADDDAGKRTVSGTGDANTAGRTLGGFSGFGLLGMAASQGPRAIGAALGYYGLAWSVYTNVVSRGREVTFEKNTAMAIRFGNSPRK